MSRRTYNYRVPHVPQFIKFTKDVFFRRKKVADRGTVSKVLEYIEADARLVKGLPIVRVYNKTIGQVIGLYYHEFVFCTEQGDTDEKVGPTV